MESVSSLMEVRLSDNQKEIGITNYADMAVYSDRYELIAIRFGGYPEKVTAMSDAIQMECTVSLNISGSVLHLHTQKGYTFMRETNYSGSYAEAIMYLRDDEQQTMDVSNQKEKQEVKVKRNLYIFCEDDYDSLMRELDRKLMAPLIPEFQDFLIPELQRNGILEPLHVLSGNDEFSAWKVSVFPEEKEVMEILDRGIKSGRITIPKLSDVSEPFPKLRGFLDYLKQFGTDLAGKIETSFQPLFDPGKEPVSKGVEEAARFVKEHTGYDLYPAQLAAAEGLKRSLKRSKVALLIAECGTGKSKISTAAVSAYQNGKKSFCVLLCPAHMCKKWVREIHETAPRTQAFWVKDIHDLIAAKNFYEEGNNSVYCVISKENARDGYMRRPAVWLRTAFLPSLALSGNIPDYGERRRITGFACPECGRIQVEPLTDGIHAVPVQAEFFLRENGRNHKCQFCGAPLWCAVNPDDVSPDRNPWIKIANYGFVWRERAARYLTDDLKDSAPEVYRKIQEILMNPDGIYPTVAAQRKYPLSTFLKRKVKRIDTLILDEVHEYSGESGQGDAMGELASAAGSIVGMTGSLINGYSKGIFYLLFRLKPQLMKMDGQEFKKPHQFCREYGVLEKKYEIAAETFAAKSRGRSRTREKFLPGVSPLVYTRFLLENAVFLSLSDMQTSLPEFEEIPCGVRMSLEVKEEYFRIEKILKDFIKKNLSAGQRMLSKYLNLLLAYPDQSYGQEAVFYPYSKDAVVVPQDMGDFGSVFEKEQKILDLIAQRVDAGEKTVLFTNWTRLDTQKKYEKNLLEMGIRTKILTASVPPSKREEWIQNQIQNGMDVLICNPRLLETGLDLNEFTCFIFSDIGFNLTTYRQASRRGYRVNQKASKVTVYLFYYEGTMQERALRLMANKLSAAVTLEGKLSDEGLAALSNSEDMIAQLARELVSGLSDYTDNLQESFQKMAILHDTADSQTHKEERETDGADGKDALLPPYPSVIRKERTETRRIVQDAYEFNLFDLLKAS